MSVKLSLCIPTNGIIEWVCPVLDSIFCQNVDESKYEVVVADNGKNKEFEYRMLQYKNAHINFIYKKTTAEGFMNQVEAFKICSGEYIKFVNHRMKMCPDSINYLLKVINDNIESKPLIYFLNGSMKIPESNYYNNIDSFLCSLSYYSSWSGGIGIWKSDFNRLPVDIVYNITFPHTSWLFYFEDKEKYILDNKVILEDIQTDHSKKGKYNLFNAFAVEYVKLIKGLTVRNVITNRTEKVILKDLSEFICDLYVDFILMRKPCSYDLTNYRIAINKYFSLKIIMLNVPMTIIKRIIKKLNR